MRTVEFQPLPDTEGSVRGLLHTPLYEMPERREAFPAVVVCPGGGYEMVSDREADPVALRFFARGYQVFILTYSVGHKAKGFTPLRELSETVALLRQNSGEWNVDPARVALCGFSAGGHLACSLGTLWDAPELLEAARDYQGRNRPDAMILCYPVITAGKYAHQGSLCHVSGCRPGEPGYEFFSLERHVGPSTCPTFLWHTVADDCVPVENSLALMDALQRHKVPFEAHLFPSGGHGMSVCTRETGSEDTYNARWVDLCLAWLDREFGYRL